MELTRVTEHVITRAAHNGAPPGGLPSIARQVATWLLQIDITGTFSDTRSTGRQWTLESEVNGVLVR